MSSSSKTPLFLIEVTIMILVFSISAGVCLMLFSYGRNIAEESRELDNAVAASENAAELWQGTWGDIDKTAELLTGTRTDEGITVYYDKEWQPTAMAGHYKLIMDISLPKADITVYKGEKEIFSLAAEAVIRGE